MCTSQLFSRDNHLTLLHLVVKIYTSDPTTFSCQDIHIGYKILCWSSTWLWSVDSFPLSSLLFMWLLPTTKSTHGDFCSLEFQSQVFEGREKNKKDLTPFLPIFGTKILRTLLIRNLMSYSCQLYSIRCSTIIVPAIDGPSATIQAPVKVAKSITCKAI